MSEKSWWEAAADVNCPACTGTGQVVLRNDGDDERSEYGICDCVGEASEPTLIERVAMAMRTCHPTIDRPVGIRMNPARTWIEVEIADDITPEQIRALGTALIAAADEDSDHD